MTKWCSIDFETCSAVDLRKTGVYRYAEDPSTQVICMAFAFDDGPVGVWKQGDPFPQAVVEHVRKDRKFRAWNAQFERVIWTTVLRRQESDLEGEAPDTQQWHCTMAQASYWGLPLKLETAAEAARIKGGKDMDGHRLMLRMSRPRRVEDDGRLVWWHEEDPAKLKALVSYCRQDVEVERTLARSLKPLPPEERAVYLLDQKINDRGICLDTRAVSKLKQITHERTKTLNKELKALTNGAVTSANQTEALRKWLLVEQAHSLPDLQKQTVETWIKALTEPNRIEPYACRALEIRQAVAKTSTAKLNAMQHVVCADGRVRGTLQYYGAFRTGRWAGRLIQPQNFPRPTIPAPAKKLDIMLKSDLNAEQVETFWGEPMEVAASCLRGCLVSAWPDGALLVVDFSQIEARVVAWLAAQTDVLSVFEHGADVYVYTAHQVGSNNRQLGKVLVLACGFGMGVGRFQETAAGFGLNLDVTEADSAVMGWRAMNSKIVDLWYECQDAFWKALDNPGQVVSVGKLQFVKWKGNVLMRLPSGRDLCYREARKTYDQEGRPRVTYKGMNQYTRKWEDIHTWGGGLVENATQAVARDVMARAMRRVDSNSRGELMIVGSVHDEVIVDCRCRLSQGLTAQNMLDRMVGIMKTRPSWAQDLPIDCEGTFSTRYRENDSLPQTARGAGIQ